MLHLRVNATLKAVVGNYERYGLRTPDHKFFETHPIVNQMLVYYVGHGDIAPRPDIERFDAEGAVFTDGTRADIDVVVFATGYLAAFPFLADDSILAIESGRPHLGLQMAAPQYANVWVSGLIQPDSGQWTIAHWQGELIAAFLSLAENLIADGARRFSGGTQYKDSSRHFYEIAHQDYLEALQVALDHIAEPAGAR